MHNRTWQQCNDFEFSELRFLLLHTEYTYYVNNFHLFSHRNVYQTFFPAGFFSRQANTVHVSIYFIRNKSRNHRKYIHCHPCGELNYLKSKLRIHFSLSLSLSLSLSFPRTCLCGGKIANTCQKL